jgi:flap endonuclease-1
MGIPKLNKWLLEHCSPTSIKKIKLSEFQDKRIAVDISIYLYKFLTDDRFMEHLYLFLSTFRYYCIQPVFVFDGKAPAEKRATIQKRNKEKQEAKNQYELVEQQLLEITDDKTRKNLENEMVSLKRKMVRITWTHIDSAIELIQAFGFEYYLAPAEADQLCVHLALTGDVFAILSDDMDLLISGAPRIMRTLNISTHELFLYDTDAILIDIKMTLQHFRETIVLSGTDYDLEARQTGYNIKKCFDLFNEYKNSGLIISFYQWLGDKGIINPEDFQHICSLFDNQNCFIELNEFLQKNKPSIPLRIDIQAIKTIMRKHKFIFV